MKTLLLIYARELGTNEIFLNQLKAELAQCDSLPYIVLNIKENSGLLDTLVWAFEASWQRLIAISDDANFTQLNSALATLNGRTLAVQNDMAIVSNSELIENCVKFKEDLKEFFIIKQSNLAPLSASVKEALIYNPQLKTASSKALLLGVDSASASLLLGPAASASSIDLQVSQIAPNISYLSLNSSAYSDIIGFGVAAKALFDERFIQQPDIFKALLDELIAKNLKISSAESCTAGLFSARLASCEGASASLVGGFCAYLRAAKRSWLGVNSLKDAAVYGPECALELAKGAQTKSGANIAVGITGVLGASSDCGIERGHVQICAYANDEQFINESIQLDASRASMQEQAVIYAAGMCIRLIHQISLD